MAPTAYISCIYDPHYYTILVTDSTMDPKAVLKRGSSVVCFHISAVIELSYGEVGGLNKVFYQFSLYFY